MKPLAPMELWPERPDRHSHPLRADRPLLVSLETAARLEVAWDLRRAADDAERARPYGPAQEMRAVYVYDEREGRYAAEEVSLGTVGHGPFYVGRGDGLSADSYLASGWRTASDDPGRGAPDEPGQRAEFEACAANTRLLFAAVLDALNSCRPLFLDRAREVLIRAHEDRRARDLGLGDPAREL